MSEILLLNEKLFITVPNLLQIAPFFSAPRTIKFDNMKLTLFIVWILEEPSFEPQGVNEIKL